MNESTETAVASSLQYELFPDLEELTRQLRRAENKRKTIMWKEEWWKWYGLHMVTLTTRFQRSIMTARMLIMGVQYVFSGNQRFWGLLKYNKPLLEMIVLAIEGHTCPFDGGSDCYCLAYELKHGDMAISDLTLIANSKEAILAVRKALDEYDEDCEDAAGGVSAVRISVQTLRNQTDSF